MSKIPGYNLEQDGVTQSLLLCFMRCKRLCEFYMQGWQPLRLSGPIEFGSITHQVLAEVYGRLRGPKPKAVTPKHIKAILGSALSEREQAAERAGAKELERLELQAAQLEVVLPAYFDFWREDFSKTQWVDLETNFRLQHTSYKHFWLNGKIDGVLRRSKGKKESLWLLETKTRGQVVEDSLVDQLVMDFQSHFYALAIWKMTHRVPRGVLYNIIRRPGLKQGQRESLPQYKERLTEDIAGRPEHYFKRFELAMEERDLVAFEQDLNYILREFEAWLAEKEQSPRNVTACFGRGVCQFVPACISGNLQGFIQRPSLFQELREE